MEKEMRRNKNNLDAWLQGLARKGKKKKYHAKNDREKVPFGIAALLSRALLVVPFCIHAAGRTFREVLIALHFVVAGIVGGLDRLRGLRGIPVFGFLRRVFAVSIIFSGLRNFKIRFPKKKSSISSSVELRAWSQLGSLSRDANPSPPQIQAPSAPNSSSPVSERQSLQITRSTSGRRTWSAPRTKKPSGPFPGSSCLSPASMKGVFLFFFLFWLLLPLFKTAKKQF